MVEETSDMKEILAEVNNENAEGLLWETVLDKNRALSSLEYIYMEGWISQELYMQCVECIKQKNRDRDEDIINLGLPNGLYRALKCTDIHTVGQLCYMLQGNIHPSNFKDFFDIRGVGIKTGLEIIEIAVAAGVIDRVEIGIAHKKRNNDKWIACWKYFDLPIKEKGM